MSIARLAIILAATTTLGAAEAATPMPEDFLVPAADEAELPDFIDPVASDFRLGYSTNVGSYRRSQDAGVGTDGHFIEHGVWASYVRAMSGYGRALSGRTEWRAEVGILASQADISNPNGSTGTLQTITLDVGVGPTWLIANRGSSRLELEVMPFVGIGRSQYANDYTSENSGVTGLTSISAAGQCLEYGLKANLMWCWANGWGAAMHAGFVQRVESLNGDSTTHWNNGSVNRGDYTSDDTLTGVRFGLFVAKRL